MPILRVQVFPQNTDLLKIYPLNHFVKCCESAGKLHTTEISRFSAQDFSLFVSRASRNNNNNNKQHLNAVQNCATDHKITDSSSGDMLTTIQEDHVQVRAAVGQSKHAFVRQTMQTGKHNHFQLATPRQFNHTQIGDLK